MQKVSPSKEISDAAASVENLSVTHTRSKSSSSHNSDVSDLCSPNENHEESQSRYEGRLRNVIQTFPPFEKSFMVTPYGTILLKLAYEYKLHVTVDEGIMLENKMINVVICLSGCGTKSALIHSSGRVYHHRDNVDILNHGSMYHYNHVKINNDGVLVEAVGCNFLVRNRDTIATYEKCIDLSDDTFTLQVFHNGCTSGPEYVGQAEYRLNHLRYSVFADKTENYRIGNLSIFQEEDGMVRIKRYGYNYVIRSSPNTRKTLILANNFKCTASTHHLNVSHAGRAMYKDRNSLKIRNGCNTFIRLDS